MKFASLEEENAQLRATLRSAWELFCDCYLKGDAPDEIRRDTAFAKLDKHLRDDLHIIGPEEAK